MISTDCKHSPENSLTHVYNYQIFHLSLQICQNDLFSANLQEIKLAVVSRRKRPSSVCEPNCQGAFLAQNWFTTNRSELGTALQATRKMRRISKIIFWSGRAGVQSRGGWIITEGDGMTSAGLERLAGLDRVRPRVLKVEFGNLGASFFDGFLIFIGWTMLWISFIGRKSDHCLALSFSV